MTLTRKDAAATLLTALVVLTFAAAHQGWQVPLVGDSYRWAAVAVFVLGAVTCGLGTPAERSGPSLFAALGAVALVLAVTAVATGSLTALSLLVAAIALLWLGATIRHALHALRRPVAT